LSPAGRSLSISTVHGGAGASPGGKGGVEGGSGGDGGEGGSDGSGDEGGAEGNGGGDGGCGGESGGEGGAAGGASATVKKALSCCPSGSVNVPITLGGSSAYESSRMPPFQLSPSSSYIMSVCSPSARQPTNLGGYSVPPLSSTYGPDPVPSPTIQSSSTPQFTSLAYSPEVKSPLTSRQGGGGDEGGEGGENVGDS
jgi:hypothetical protein